MGNEMTINEMTISESLSEFRQRIEEGILFAKSFTIVKREDGTIAENPDEFEQKNKIGREMAIVLTKLEEAQMWVDRCFEKLNEEMSLYEQLKRKRYPIHNGWNIAKKPTKNRED